MTGNRARPRACLWFRNIFRSLRYVVSSIRCHAKDDAREIMFRGNVLICYRKISFGTGGMFENLKRDSCKNFKNDPKEGGEKGVLKIAGEQKKYKLILKIKQNGKIFYLVYLLIQT